MKVKTWLFPTVPRHFPGERWLDIGLRSAHLVGVAGAGAGFLFGLPEARWLAFWQLTLVTGVALSLLYLWSDAAWMVQVKGVSMLAKLGLVAGAIHWSAWRGELFMFVIVLSAVVAHAPARVRCRRLI